MNKDSFIQQLVRASWLRLMLVLLPVMMAILPATAWAAIGDELDEVIVDGMNYKVLRNAADWEVFRNMVMASANEDDVNVIMGADFTITTMAGDENHHFRGIFNGNGHTLTVEIDDPNREKLAAPFHYATEATFQDLHIKGNVHGGKHSGGIVGRCGKDDRNCHITFERVWCSVNVNTYDYGDDLGNFCGGFIGHAKQNIILMKDCRYDGTLQNGHVMEGDGNKAGAFFGWGDLKDNALVYEAHRIYDAGIAINTNYNIGYYADDGNWCTWGHAPKGCSSIYSATKWYALYDSEVITDQDEVVRKMHEEKMDTWVIVNGKAVPDIKKYSTDPSFECYDMVPGTAVGEEGMLKIPFSCDQVVKWIDYWYIDENGNKKDMPRLTLPKNSYSGFLLVPATEAHRELHMNVRLMIDELEYTYDPKSDAVMHNPRQLKATLLNYSTNKQLADAGAIQLQWTTKEPKYNDALGGDQFVVLRSLTGKDEDLKTIGSVDLEDNDSVYFYKDSTLVKDLTQELIDKGMVQVKYVVARASAQQLWGLSNNPATVAVTYDLEFPHLLRIADYNAQWQDETERTVKVTWDYANDYGAMWDSRAKYSMLVSSANSAKEPVDSTTYVLTADEMQACSKELPLVRSCVDFKIEFLVERGSSPLPLEAQGEVFKIASAEDWEAFANAVKDAKGSKDVNAMLMADIAVSTRVATKQEEAYRGIFNGNGHTITATIESGSDPNVALFGYASTSTFRNLHVAGSSKSSNKFLAGMISTLTEDCTVLIEGCRVSAILTSTVTGDATMGGFVGNANYAALLTLRNCKFDGSFEGENCNSNGGMVGWSNKLVTIENCVFAPQHIGTQYGDCATWARIREQSGLTVINSYCTELFEERYKDVFYINSADDWNSFVSTLASANGEALINVIMTADISVNTTTPSNVYWKGTFDGNGHTLNVNIDKPGDIFIAPFIGAKNYTIKNLHVTGTVNGAKHSAGLVASSENDGSSANVISNCRVSVKLTIADDYAGGFIGHGHSSNHTITNCLFDGEIVCTSTSGAPSFAGAIIGWEDGGTSNVIKNCLENGTYANFANTAMNFNAENGGTPYGVNGNCSNNWGYHYWNELNGNNAINMTVASLIENLGADWQDMGGVALPVLYSDQAVATRFSGRTNDEILELLGGYWMKDGNGKLMPCVEDRRQADVSPAPSDMPTFYHENNGHIDKQSLTIRELQTSTLLTWSNVDDEPVDYYEVWRREVNAEEAECIAQNLTEMQFEDKKTSPVHQYEYYVRGVNDCEGTKFEDTEKVIGHCVQTATISGSFRFKDGTGIPGKEVTTTLPDGTTKTAITDESGNFVMSDLPYVDATETNYRIAPNVPDFSDYKNITIGTLPGQNVVSNVEFVLETSVRFSGYVQYRGTSIPVQGVSFKVDGYEVHNAEGKVVTDHEGKFTFHMLKGPHDSIQAMKDGHVFFHDGFYHETDDELDTEKECAFYEDQASIYFYDDTKVKLIGRVAGGKEQAAIPLGNSLSKNNLGDDLQIVMALEGDNASRLVWDIKDKSKKERDEEFTHQAHDKMYEYKTTVHTTINRKVVTPDVHTGEYEVLLPPVKWKIQQITAKGYATLFQDGQVGDVIDLSDSLTAHSDTIKGLWKNAEQADVTEAVVNYHAQYNRIYHSPVVIDYKQIGFEKFDFFGDQYYNFKNITGDKQKLALAYAVKKNNWPKGKRDSLETKYTFGYPVFSIERKYPVKISATERYYYNNNTKSDTIDVIRLSGGEVTIQNGMVSSIHRDVVELDSVGEATYNLAAAQLPYLLTGVDALRTVTMTLEMDGTHYEAIPLRAYILNIRDIKGAKDIINHSVPQLVDILRDPPGGASKATISKGSTLKYSYQMDMNWSAGLSMHISEGTGFNSFQGFVGAPFGSGIVGGFNYTTSSKFDMTFDLVFSGSGQRAFTYTMTANEDISTSGEKSMVGADADLYIGLEQNIILKRATAIRAIPDSTFTQAKGLLAAGRMVEIAQGQDDQGHKLHLVRDEVITYGPKVTSNFVHSQKYILTQLLPSLKNQCLALMFTGTESEAQLRANATGQPVYYSKVNPDDENFGFEYDMKTPSGSKEQFVDEVKHYKEIIAKWMEMIAQNEKEKLEARDLVQNFSTDGGSSLSYSETFTSDYSKMSSYISPITPMTSEYFDNFLKDGATSIVAAVGPTVAKFLAKILQDKGGSRDIATTRDDENNITSIDFKLIGVQTSLSLTPAVNFSVTPRHSEAKSYSRKEGFTIGMDNRSHLDFDVYRVKTASTGLEGYDVHDVFLSDNFYEQVDYDEDYLRREMKLEDVTYAHSFVYRTRAGATCRPWEGERVTQFYNPGTMLDERTKKIENPVITMDKQSISGVPFGEAARFKIYLTNESEQPEAAYAYFDIYQSERSNPDGAKMMIDGMPLTGNTRTVEVKPGVVTEKTLEVYAGEKFDYEGLKIGIISQGDVNTYQEVSFDVHYLQTAGAVAITTPGDKWIMNCDAPQDGDKGWYLPVIISNFDKNQHNFDHIEFQYKESTRGDDYWTNLCGYYADSTRYAAASGTKEMIPENGNITTRFFGEGTVMEKAYDLRAVLFCRNGNSFLTYESKMLSGVKDTRRPMLFGIPEPKDAVLGVGENVIFSFSEDIEYNYLQETTNFEVKGETNEAAIQEAPALRFGGKGYAQSEVRRNFADKNVTIEVMIKPDEVDRDMPIFSHGSYGKQLQLWLTKEKHLRAVVDDKVLESDSIVKTTAFQRVALVLDNDNEKLYLYSEHQDAVMEGVTYSGNGPLVFGSAIPTGSPRAYYEGRMLQGRIWHRALDLTLLNAYADHLLTGYEKGLTDYYPMNEGKGDYATDLAQGAHLTLKGATWTLPEGMALKFDKNAAPQDATKKKGVQVKADFFTRDDEQNYTLMFWFRTAEESAALFSNGSGRTTDVDAKNKFFIGIEDHTLKYRTNGREYELGDNLCDDAWHHYAMAVNRMRQVASIYVDNELKAQFSTDSLGGMTGTDFYFGNMVWKDASDNTKLLEDNALTGYIDGIALFQQALPVSLIKRYSNKSPGGAEKGLLTYVDFERQELQSSGDLALQPYVLSKVQKFDDKGNLTDKHDTIFVDSVSYVMARVDQKVGAPVQAYVELKHLNFSFVGRNNQLLVNVDELDSRINKKSISVTVSDIPDKNGNFMASPVTETFFVNRNPLKWMTNRYDRTLKAGEEHTLSLIIVNEGGAAHTYTIENLPRWMTVNKTSDIVEPQSNDNLEFTISKDVNVGTYDQIVYLTDENGLSEPLAINIVIEGEKPDWTVDPEMMRYTMNVVGRVYVGNTIVTDSRDIVGVFDANNRCMGRTNVEYDSETGQSMVYLTVYDSTTVVTPLFFRLWHYATGKTMQLTTSVLVNFVNQSIIGSMDSPVLMMADDLYEQEINLKRGWNWVSFNVNNVSLQRVSSFLGMFPWKDGDILTEDTEDLTLVYKNGQWMSNTSTDISAVGLSQKYCYRIKVQEDIDVSLWGTSLRDEKLRTIDVKKGWNSIGYTPMVNLPIATALAEYYDEAMPGDVIKNQHEFAIFASDGAGGGKWSGSLKYMKPGEGYMLHRLKDSNTSFTYPYYEPGATFIDIGSTKHNASRFAMTMTVVAEAVGVDLEEGDQLVAYANGEVVGSETLQADGDNLFYLSIEGENNTPLSFAIERGGEMIATTSDVMNYEANAISGSPAKPTKISFVQIDQLPQDGWYTLQGIKLQHAPTKSGVYIYNGHKQVIK